MKKKCNGIFRLFTKCDQIAMKDEEVWKSRSASFLARLTKILG